MYIGTKRATNIANKVKLIINYFTIYYKNTFIFEACIF